MWGGAGRGGAGRMLKIQIAFRRINVGGSGVRIISEILREMILQVNVKIGITVKK